VPLAAVLLLVPAAILVANLAAALPARAAAVLRDVAAVVGAARALRATLEGMQAEPLQDARRDVETQLARLLLPGFAAKHGAPRLPDVLRYLQGAARRLERVPAAPGADRDRMRAVQELEALWRAKLEAWPADRPLPPALHEARWLLEELAPVRRTRARFNRIATYAAAVWSQKYRQFRLRSSRFWRWALASVLSRATRHPHIVWRLPCTR
jgi:hypothetical protein